MKNSYITLLVFLFLLIGQRALGESVTKKVHFNFSELKCDTITGGDGQVYSSISYPGCGRSEIIGFPVIPYQFVKFVLPDAAKKISVNIQSSDTIVKFLPSRIYPAQRGLSFSQQTYDIPFVPCDSLIYNSGTQYPSEKGHLYSVNQLFQKEKEVIVEVYPVSYYPLENKCVFSESLSVSLSYSSDQEQQESLRNQITSSSLGLPFYNYCIITKRYLKDSFNRLIAWKREKGLNAGVVCVEDILSNEQIQRDGIAGPNDDAGKIRQYLRLMYNSLSLDIDENNLNWKDIYVLLGGDSEVVPIRKAKRENDLNYMISEDTNIPTDWYYSELETVWPTSEETEFQPSHNSPQLSVGRLLCTTPEEVEYYTNKLMRYELNPGDGNYNYLKKGFYLQADVGQELHMADSIASWSSNIFTTRTIYEEDPSYNASNPTFPTGNQVISKLNERYGYASFYTHGTPYCIKTKTNGNNDEHSQYNPTTCAITSIQGADSIIVHETTNGLDKLDNGKYPMFMFTASCHSATFDTFANYNQYPCIGRSFTSLGNYGGPAMIGCTRLGPVASSYLFQKKFNENILQSWYDWGHVGAALKHTKYYCTQSDSIQHKLYLIYTTNLIGCPELRLWTAPPSTFTLLYEYSTIGLYFTWLSDPAEHTFIGTRRIDTEDDSCELIPQTSDGQGQTVYNPENTIITLHGKNHLPTILPLYIQNTYLKGKHYLITKDVLCGSSLIESSDDDPDMAVFKNGSDYTFEKRGKFTLVKNVVVEKGAKLKVINSTVNY